MATQLTRRITKNEFISYIQQATEAEAWGAIVDAVMFSNRARLAKSKREELDITIDKAMSAYEKTFGTPWKPF